MLATRFRWLVAQGMAPERILVLMPSSAQADAMREHLEAAVENDDPAEARRVLAGAEFSDAQRRYVEDVLGAWERARATARR